MLTNCKLKRIIGDMTDEMHKKCANESVTPTGSSTETLTARERSLANLRPPWKPGQSGNPDCKNLRRGKPLLTQLEESVNVDEAKALIAAALERAKKGDFKHLEHIWNRLEGKVPDKIETEIGNAGVDLEKLPAGVLIQIQALLKPYLPAPKEEPVEVKSEPKTQDKVTLEQGIDSD